MIRQTICGLLLASALATAASAEDYLCELKDAGRYNTIPEKVYVSIAPDGQSAEVVDPFLHFMEQAPKKASFVKNTSNLLRVRWVVEDMNFSNGGVSDMMFSLTYRKDKGKAHINLTIPSFDNTDRGTGRCTLQK